MALALATTTEQTALDFQDMAAFLARHGYEARVRVVSDAQLMRLWRAQQRPEGPTPNSRMYPVALGRVAPYRDCTEIRLAVSWSRTPKRREHHALAVLELTLLLQGGLSIATSRTLATHACTYARQERGGHMQIRTWAQRRVRLPIS